MKSPQDLIKSVREHNSWRRGDDSEMADPTQIGKDLEDICLTLEGFIKEVDAWEAREAIEWTNYPELK